MFRLHSKWHGKSIPTIMTIVLGISILSFLSLAVLRSVRSQTSAKSKGGSVSRRIELASYHPQPPASATTADQPPDLFGPVPLPDPNAPAPKTARSGIDTPKLRNPQETARETSLANANASVVKDLVGSNTCAECHPGEHALHFGSGHARTLRPAGRHPVVRKMADKIFRDEEDAKALWRYLIAGDRVEAMLHKPDQPAQCVPLDWAVGSGEHGITFVSILFDPKIGQYKGLEHRLSYLTDGNHFVVTPGQAERDLTSKSAELNETGRVLDRKGLVQCLECHSTVTSDKKPGDFDQHSIVPNISCERCHGPGRSHVEAARLGLDESKLKMPLGADTSTPFRQIHECGTCHRRINLVPPSQIHPDNYELARFQPVGIEASLCYQQGKSGLKCTTCHDPHAKVSRDRSAYVSACVNCHEGPGKSTCKVEPKGDCISCHMPKRTVSEVFRFTDHWIRIPKSAKAE